MDRKSSGSSGMATGMAYFQTDLLCAHETPRHGADNEVMEEKPGFLSAVRNLQILGGHNTFVSGDVHIRTQERAPKVDIWAALSTVSNHRQIQQDTVSKATLKTGEWIFEHGPFPIWRDPEGALETMWGSGIPGAGKSVLLSIVINNFQRWASEAASPICVGYIYIRYSDNMGLTVRDCLEILVKQSVEQNSDYLQLAEEVYARHVQLQTRPTDAELLCLLQRFTDKAKGTFYFLDALDEAPTEIQLDLVTKLRTLKAKLFITSRPLKLLQERFPDAHHFDITAQDCDLDLHIESKLDASQELWKVLEEGGQELRADIVASVKKACGGMFLHASLQLAALQQCASIGDVMETLANFPPRIEDVYRNTWRRIVDQTSSSGFLAQTCIIWVLHAPTSMTVPELQYAAATSLDTHQHDPHKIVHQDTLVALCRGLLVVDEETMLVRLVHYTAKDILPSLIVETSHHLYSLMTLLCMSRLINHGFQCWEGGRSLRSLHKALKADPLLPFSYYAWSLYARHSLGDIAIATQVKDFVRGCRAFPVDTGNWFDLALLGPLHLVSFYDLPISLAVTDPQNISDPNPRTTRKQTPLHLACLRKSRRTTRELLTVPRILVNATDANRDTPLVYAVMSGDVDTVKLLLAEPKIRVDGTSKGDLTVLMWASRRGNEGAAKLVYNHSPAAIRCRDGLGKTALSYACEDGHEGMVKLLLLYSQGEVHSVDRWGKTPLAWASQKGHAAIIKVLLPYSRAEVHLADKIGRTPLSWASSSNCANTFRLLLSHYSEQELSLADRGGRTPLIWAALTGSDATVKVLLAQSRVGVNQADNEGWTPLMWAAKRDPRLSRDVPAGQAKSILEALLAHPQVNVNLVDRRGRSALSWASSVQSAEAVEPLLAHPHIEVNTPDRTGRTALSWASSSGNEETINLLLGCPHIDVNLPDREGRTPLMWAMKHNRFTLDGGFNNRPEFKAVVQALLAHPEIDASLMDNRGRTALSWASTQGHPNVVNLLLGHPQVQAARPYRSLGQRLGSAFQRVRDIWSR